ncbi:unnamed protein product [Moneuplotes crassus]|uniref:Uncharacterized protein n=1 Tax=Euplotes crassus TaxID=5936 RepID=A0AAD1URQ0_EUPCR|nr:unnamed protein product [Moneuplotes crassus]
MNRTETFCWIPTLIPSTLEKSIMEETKEQEVTRCQNIVYKIYPDERKIEPLDSEFGEASGNSRIQIGFRDFKNVKLEQSLKNLIFFDVNRIDFESIDSKNRHLVDFLESSFPNKTNEFYFNSRNKIDLNRSNYLNSLLRLSSKVTQKVSFNSLFIGLPQLKRLVAAYKHVRVLILWGSKLSIPSVPDLSKALTNCQIQKLGLFGSGSYHLSDWKSNFYQFKNLIQGLASSPDLRLSLKEVDIIYCCVNQNEAQQVFEENQLGDVEIIGGN